MNKKMDIIKQCIYLGGVSLIGMVLFYNEQQKVLLPLCLSLIVLWYIETRYFNEEENKIYAIWAIEYIVMLAICSKEQTGMSVLLLLVLIGNIILSSTLKRGVLITVITYIGYIITMKLSHGSQYTLYGIFMATMNFGITYLLVYSIRYQIVQKQKAEQTAKELLKKTEELEWAYKKLQVFYEEQEEVALLKERNRIAGEIHDTVGHRLTTAIVQLEASIRLIDRDKEKALEKLSIAQSQVREGLKDIRHAVRAMKESEEILSLSHRVTTFINELSKNSDVVIKSNIKDLPNLDNKLENILFRGIQEGFTNGMRHGQSTYFSLDIYCKEDNVFLILKDYGIGCENLIFGFGLNNMKKNVGDLGGILEISSKYKEGTTLIIKIPINISSTKN